MLSFGPRDKIFDFRYFAPLIRLACSEGATLDRLLTETRIPIAALAEDEYKVCASQLEALITNIADQCRPEIFLDYGSSMNLSAFGIVGYAALSSPTVRDALRIANQYMPIILPGLDIQFTEQGDTTQIQLNWSYPITEKVQIALLETALSSMYTMAHYVLLDKMPQVQMQVKHPLADYHQRYVQNKSVHFNGDCKYNQMIMPRDVLDFPLPLANQNAFKMSVKQCDALMNALPLQDRTLTAGIQRRLLHYLGDQPLTQEDIAAELFMSVRSLHRFLQREGTSFRDISKDVIAIRAKHLLRQADISISQIAQELGYTDAANFTRAFRHHTGVTPSEYRKNPG
jgi:AraC-like DNA-binding protein